MVEENYKPEAKCRFYAECAIYNAGILRDKVEVEMCGRGFHIDKDYEPKIRRTYTPPSKSSGSSIVEVVCDAFYGKVDTYVLGKIRACLEGSDWFWQGKKKLEEISGSRT